MRLLPFQKHFLEKEKEEKTALTQDKLDAMQLNFFLKNKMSVIIRDIFYLGY